MTEQTIQLFLDAHDYDIRKSHNGRWIDQKCTLDVVALVADCILQYVKDREDCTFSVNDIWYSEYTVENVLDIFRKPDPTAKAFNEYDKYFGQPIKLLDASGIIHGTRTGHSYAYSIVNQELLEYISLKDRNCLQFLCLYIEKVLRDSGIYPLFEEFFQEQNKDSFRVLKDGYSSFITDNTPINGALECGRIFTKVLNPLAYKYNKRGTVRGRLSKHAITRDMLFYNQPNWRDILSDKPKDITRQEYLALHPELEDSRMDRYRIQRSKSHLRDFNDRYRGGRSELYEERHMADPATQMHHIFPAGDFPEIADEIENLIALTPTQHYSYAHPNNQTQYVGKDYQRLCLIAKVNSIRKNLLGNAGEPVIYEFDSLRKVLNAGFHTTEFDEVADMDFDQILRKIDSCFQ